jgi:hypothetical protein
MLDAFALEYGRWPMATQNRQAPESRVVQAALARLLPLEKTAKDAWKLMLRFREAEGFRNYLRLRLPLVIPAMALFVLISVACAAAIVIFLADRHALLALPGMVLAPFVLAGSFFVQAYVFFSWLETRALAQALGRRKKTPFDFGQFPRVPWALGGVFLILPLAILAAISGTTALVLILLVVATTVLFARFDR